MEHASVKTADRLSAILGRYGRERRHAMAVLQDVQRELRHIPGEHIGAIAEYLDLPAAELYAMATFYKAFSLVPKGRHLIKVCDGTACHIRGAGRLADTIARELCIRPGETTADGVFSLEMVNCLGACALAPAMAVDETYYGQLTADRLGEILEAYRREGGEGDA